MGGWTHDFWLRVDIVNDDHSCWIWTGAKRSGYGRLKKNGRLVHAHVYSFEEKNGFVPDGMVVRHKCNNKSCVRPDHLLLGTQKDNVHDSISSGTHRHQRMPGELHPMSKLKASQVQDIRLRLLRGESVKNLAYEFGVQPRQIRRIRSGERWNDFGGSRTTTETVTGGS